MMKKNISFAVLLIFFNVLIFCQPKTPLVSSIHAQASGVNKIEVTWDIPLFDDGSVNSLLLYRDTRPISEDSIKNLSSIAKLSPTSLSYADYPGDFRDYFYAVICMVSEGNTNARIVDENGYAEELYYDEERDAPPSLNGGSPYLVLLPGVNTTVESCRINGNKAISNDTTNALLPPTEKSYDAGELREQPLPYMDILGNTEGLAGGKISVRAEEQALSLISTAEKKKVLPLEQYIFAEDMLSPDSGDEYLLFDVLKNSFIKKNYVKATKDLQRFLAQNRSQTVTDRAHFYLGESFYFCGDYPSALGQFLLLNDTFPTLTNKWIKSSLDLYQIPTE